MEGASFLYACRMNNIACLQIRAISNRVERRNKESWDIENSLENLTEKLIEILNTI